MSTRRSSRIQSLEAKRLVETDTQPTSEEPNNGTKCKATTADSGRFQTTLVPNNKLPFLPVEIFTLIFENVQDKRTLSRLGRTCRRFYLLVNPILYRQICVAAAYHAHIDRFIRTIEPHLSIRQRKQLKKEGKYMGQQQTYSETISPEEKPAYVSKKDLVELGLFGSILGHIGDGNFHETILFENKQHKEVEDCVDRMVYRALEMEGTCTGEHGIGLGKKGFLKAEVGDAPIQVVRAIKTSLDPHWLMNPGKIFDRN
ncbi:hypothetical protein ACHAPU_005754 [Fusarium lateritium]